MAYRRELPAWSRAWILLNLVYLSLGYSGGVQEGVTSVEQGMDVVKSCRIIVINVITTILYTKYLILNYVMYVILLL